MKKLLACLFAAVGLFVFAACGTSNGAGKTVANVIKEENMVIITIEEVDGEPTLLDVMNDLKDGGKLTFTVLADGMVASIEGKENAADWSAVWMLYTSDSEMVNAEWGTVEYNGESYGSAVVGANALGVLAGERYIWYYQSF
ncbi:MAG: hypothetical protein J6A87_02550 [Clostridia bacterium]|nr:hypothetical protein [Clostridia bacterium]